MWTFRVTVTYPGEESVTEVYHSLERALAIIARVVDSPTNLCPVVELQREKL